MSYYNPTDLEMVFADFGRNMMNFSETFGATVSIKQISESGIETLNQLSILGNKLTKIGTAFGPSVSDLTLEEKILLNDFIKQNITIQTK